MGFSFLSGVLFGAFYRLGGERGCGVRCRQIRLAVMTRFSVRTVLQATGDAIRQVYAIADVVVLLSVAAVTVLVCAVCSVLWHHPEKILVLVVIYLLLDRRWPS